MTPFEQFPNLFANGEFYAKTYACEGRIEACYAGHSIDVADDREGMLVNVLAKEATLIARPISDMTDEEVKELYPMATTGKGITVLKNHLITEANTDGLLGWEERGLAKIGVYFGPQSHFEDGTVINGAKND